MGWGMPSPGMYRQRFLDSFGARPPADPMQAELESIHAGTGPLPQGPDWDPVMRDFYGLPSAEEEAYYAMPGPKQLPVDPATIEARIKQLEAQSLAEYDAANPGRRDYNAARQANPGGRPFRTSELHNLSPDAQGYAGTTISGTGWGNAYGDVDAERGLPGADRNSINAVPLRDLIDGTPRARPVSVMDQGGGTKNIYPGAPQDPTFGGDTTVRQIGGRNYFVDKGSAPVAGQAGDAGPVNYVGERDRQTLDQIAGLSAGPGGEELTVDRRALNRKLGSGVNDIVTHQYGEDGNIQRDRFGNPLKDPVIAQAQQEYRDTQRAIEQQKMADGRRNYQLKQNGLAAIPVPDWAMQPQFPGGPPIIAGGMGGRGGMSSEDMIKAQIAGRQIDSNNANAQADREQRAELAKQEAANAQAERESRKEIAGMGVKPELDPEDAAEIGGIIEDKRTGRISPQDAKAQLDAIRQRRAAAKNTGNGATPPPTSTVVTKPEAPFKYGQGQEIPTWARRGGTYDGEVLKGDELIAAARGKGKTDAEINEVIKQSAGNSYADMQDENGLTIGDWVGGMFPPAMPFYHGSSIMQGEFPRHPIGRMLGLQ